MRLVIGVAIGLIPLSLAACALLIDTDGLAGGTDAFGADADDAARASDTGRSSDGSTGNVEASPCGANLALDPKNCGQCGHDCLGAACTDSECAVTVLAASQTSPAGIALDGDQVYWTNSSASGQVMQCAQAGCGGVPTVVATAEDAPSAIAISGQALFWGSMGSGGVRCRPLASDAGPATAVPQSFPVQTVVFTNNKLYVSDDVNSAIQLYHWGIGCSSSSYFGFIVAKPSQPKVRSLVVQNATAFWISSEEIRSCNVTPPGCDASTTLRVATNQPSARALAVDLFDVYWTNDDGTILHAPVGGLPDASAPAQLAAGLSHPFSIAIQGGDVYFATHGTGATDGTIAKVSKSGGQPLVLSSKHKRPYALAVAGQYVYWTDVDEGTVNRLPL